MRSSPIILKRLQSLLGIDTVNRIEVCRTGHMPPQAPATSP
jgi:hypothetical protein